MSQANALITWGGWDGHQPKEMAHLIASLLSEEGLTSDIHESLECFDDFETLCVYDVIVPIWTMSKIEKHQATNVSEAVARGTGLAGCHGGMCDAFRESVLWQFMTGANWVSHPGGDGVRYSVKIVDHDHELVEGLEDFDVVTEQYYLHVDPANHVLASTRFPTTNWYHSPNGAVDIPVAWTRRWGAGRVYYNSLGHQVKVFDGGPPLEMLRRGLLWAANSKAAAGAAGISVEDYLGVGNNF